MAIFSYFMYLKYPYIGELVVQKSQKISLRNIKMVPKGKNIQKLWEKGKKIPTLVFVVGKLYVMAPKLHEL